MLARGLATRTGGSPCGVDELVIGVRVEQSVLVRFDFETVLGVHRARRKTVSDDQGRVEKQLTSSCSNRQDGSCWRTSRDRGIWPTEGRAPSLHACRVVHRRASSRLGEGKGQRRSFDDSRGQLLTTEHGLAIHGGDHVVLLLRTFADHLRRNKSVRAPPSWLLPFDSR